MSQVEITLRSGLQVTAEVSAFTVQKSPITGQLTGVRWETKAEANRALLHVSVDEIAAVVFIDEEKPCD